MELGAQIIDMIRSLFNVFVWLWIIDLEIAKPK